jgi:hypothetical protein
MGFYEDATSNKEKYGNYQVAYPQNELSNA